MKYLTHCTSVVAALLMSLLLLSCSKDRTSNSSLPGLKVGAMSSLDYIPYVVAEKMGIYDSLGLEVEIVKFFSANDRDAAFRSGSVDGTVIDYTGAAIQHASGEVPLALVVRHDGFFELMAQPSIGSLFKLRGKKVAVSRNTVIEYATDMMLESAAIHESRVEKPEINKIPLRMEMLVAGEIDASLFPDPFISIARQKGFVSLCSTRDLDISVTGTMFARETIEEKGESIKALLVGYNLAVDYLNSHPRSDWQQILVEDAGVPEELVDLVSLPRYKHASLPSDRDMEQTISWLKYKGLVPADYTGEELVDGSFLP